VVFLDLRYTLYRKNSNLRNCILNESKLQDSCFLLLPNNIPVILRQFSELNDMVLSDFGTWFLYSSAADPFPLSAAHGLFWRKFVFHICM